jgi:hypothetical protein
MAVMFRARCARTGRRGIRARRGCSVEETARSSDRDTPPRVTILSESVEAFVGRSLGRALAPSRPGGGVLKQRAPSSRRRGSPRYSAISDESLTDDGPKWRKIECSDESCDRDHVFSIQFRRRIVHARASTTLWEVLVAPDENLLPERGPGADEGDEKPVHLWPSERMGNRVLIMA